VSAVVRRPITTTQDQSTTFIEAVMLAATAIAFLLAVTIPDAFADAGGWFAATYLAVRVLGLGLYGRVAWDEGAKRAAPRPRCAAAAPRCRAAGC
jgi:low temperature requirement protein LtrA